MRRRLNEFAPPSQLNRSVASFWMNRSLIRHASWGLIIAAALLCTSCSFTNNFIVVNASRAILTVTYRVKPPNVPGAPTDLPDQSPRTKPVSQVGEDIDWQPLPSSRYKADAQNRVVTLTLNPDEALLLTECRPANNASTGDCEPDAFDVSGNWTRRLERRNQTCGRTGA